MGNIKWMSLGLILLGIAFFTSIFTNCDQGFKTKSTQESTHPGEETVSDEYGKEPDYTIKGIHLQSLSDETSYLVNSVSGDDWSEITLNSDNSLKAPLKLTQSSNTKQTVNTSETLQDEVYIYLLKKEDSSCQEEAIKMSVDHQDIPGNFSFSPFPYADSEDCWGTVTQSNAPEDRPAMVGLNIENRGSKLAIEQLSGSNTGYLVPLSSLVQFDQSRNPNSTPVEEDTQEIPQCLFRHSSDEDYRVVHWAEVKDESRCKEICQYMNDKQELPSQCQFEEKEVFNSLSKTKDESSEEPEQPGDADTSDTNDPKDSPDSVIQLPTATRTVHVSSSSQLSSALSNAKAGDRILLRNGHYTGNFDINKKATSADPIVIVAQEKLQARFSGRFQVKGSNIWILGMNFDGTKDGDVIQVTGSKHKISGNRFANFGRSDRFTINTAISMPDRTDHLEISYNLFDSPAKFRSWSPSDGKYVQMRFGIRGRHDSGKEPYDLHIHHNHFKRFPGKPSDHYASAQSDAIEVQPIASSATTRTIIEYNLFENIVDQSGSVTDIKAGKGGTFQFNTILNSGGRVDVRSAIDWTVKHNWFENSQGIGVYGANHKIIGNYFKSGSIRLLRGDNSGPSKVGYDQVKNTLVECNTSTMTVGVDFSSVGTSYLPKNITIKGHSGSIKIQNGSDVTQNKSFKCPKKKATKLNPSQVGPYAADFAT